MDKESLKKLLDDHKKGRIALDKVVEKLNFHSYEKMEDATIDNWRGLRTGFPEVIFGMCKSRGQVAAIVKRMMRENATILVTRSPAGLDKDLRRMRISFYNNAKAGTVTIGKPRRFAGKVAVITAGTGDIPVAEEAAETVEAMGVEAVRTYDVGVAGLHRILDKVKLIRTCDALVVIAGMEGALPSVVAGLVDVPVIAVPTSVGYGAHLNGIAPLLTMLNSCAAGVSVVNIDNGFAAGYQAALISRKKAVGC
jgi:NCAIR mutase (PurE)-related protein